MKLPSDVRPQNLLKVLKRNGYLETNKVGSHIHLHHAKGTLKAILNQTELSIEEFKKLLK